MTTLTAMPSAMDDKANPVCNVLGVGVSAINLDRAVSTIAGWIDRREHNYVCVTGVHGVMESQRSPELKRIHNDAGMVTPDGMPMVWLSQLGGFSDVSRVYGPDLMEAVCTQSVAKGWRHYFYGGAEGVAERLKDRLTARFPELKVVGTFCPPFRPMSAEEDAELIRAIDAAGPDIIWIGLSTPKQEYWMDQHIHRLKAPVLVGVGAAFDFHAGVKNQAPRWMQRSGLEWFFRLITEPRRLWKRYLINNPLFISYVLAEKLRLKNFQ
ncbi:MAG TPA: WecB/TagA/CpsF family glycosyltransferase [Tepidisphaeraceae bacterium]|jgi:N-acetylglucosaminyldiphosphoundecaprenol N-acetyl-beta-D-mannosaminyltransferase|nr:WecB/TagA/CpsF family glycosyltransferase [Tepidisphaeraceae bacterium]